MRNILILITSLSLLLFSCAESTEYRYRLDTNLKGKGDSMILETTLSTWEPTVWVGEVIYENTRDVSKDSLDIYIKQEKEKAMNFLSEWMRVENIKDTVNINR